MKPTDTPIPGIHHITAIASSAAENRCFYTEVLGLRMVKQTVNFDDPYTYHLYFGDETGTPGTIMTFFPWEDLPPGRAGAGMISALAFSVPAAALAFWTDRLAENGFAVEKEVRFSEPVLRFADPHGLALELVGTEPGAEVRPWTEAGVPEEAAIFGFHSATALFRDAAESRRLATELLGMRPNAAESNRTRYAMADRRAPGRFFDIVEDPSAPRARSGAGTVHHIAFRARDESEQLAWRRRVADFGVEVTPVIDRNYFRSIYFREAGGVLFEIATDPPGFTVDETAPRLGSYLMLPPRYEPRRAEIESRLPAIDLRPAQHWRPDCTLDRCALSG